MYNFVSRVCHFANLYVNSYVSCFRLLRITNCIYVVPTGTHCSTYLNGRVRRMRYYCNFEFIANVIRLQEYYQYMDIGTFCSVFSYETRSHCVPSAWAFKIHNSERMNTYIHISIINLLYFCRNNIYIKDKNCLIF